jgi:hypothetical protein
MIKYYSRDHSDTRHLYKYDDKTKRFYWMDHAWTGEGEWVYRDEPLKGIVEISEERAMLISVGTLYTAPTKEK